MIVVCSRASVVAARCSLSVDLEQVVWACRKEPSESDEREAGSTEA